MQPPQPPRLHAPFGRPGCDVPQVLSLLREAQAALKEGTSGYLVGGRLTYADMAMAVAVQVSATQRLVGGGLVGLLAGRQAGRVAACPQPCERLTRVSARAHARTRTQGLRSSVGPLVLGPPLLVGACCVHVRAAGHVVRTRTASRHTPTAYADTPPRNTLHGA